MIQSIAFYFLSGVLILSALMVVTQRNVFTCAIYLAVTLSMIAGLFVLLGADFLAAVQILLYVGGILVILAFVVMLCSLQQAKAMSQINKQWIPGSMACLGIFMMILIGLKKNPFPVGQIDYRPTTEPIGKLLLGEMILPFEVVSLILLASLVGAVLFSKRENIGETNDE